MFLWRSLLSCFHITGYKINWMSLFFQPFDCLFQCLLAFTIWLESVNIVCPLYVMCHFSLALLLITSFFIVASCRLTVMFWVFPIWDLWWVLDVLLNITKCELCFFFFTISSIFSCLFILFFFRDPVCTCIDIWYCTRNLTFCSFESIIFFFFRWDTFYWPTFNTDSDAELP